VTSESHEARLALGRLRAEVGKAVVGQDPVVGGVLVALLCGGHVLLEGVPGVAKTLLVRALSAALDLETRRLQFTPDLMPGDVTGSMVYNAGAFDFRPGPVFTNLLLADEINRTPPKTQSALLEAMEERQVSVDGEARPLPQPFLVAATQNPIEYEAGVSAVASAADLAAGRAAVRQVQVADEVLTYIVDLVGATRRTPAFELGASPRGTIALLAVAKAYAWLSGRDYVIPDDVKGYVVPTLRHRVRLRADAALDGVTVESVLAAVIAAVPAPR
jgi:MoxR-like ATPase